MTSLWGLYRRYNNLSGLSSLICPIYVIFNRKFVNFFKEGEQTERLTFLLENVTKNKVREKIILISVNFIGRKLAWSFDHV